MTGSGSKAHQQTDVLYCLRLSSDGLMNMIPQYFLMSVSGTSLDSDKPVTILCVRETDYWCCPISNRFDSTRVLAQIIIICDKKWRV